jgi:hypothetical protein
LQLNFSCLRQIACDKLVINDKRYCMKEKVNKYISSFDSIVYVLSHVIKMQLFWSQLRANDVSPRVLIFDYLKYNYYYYFEMIYDVQFKYLANFIL